ncbi:MAG: hypothetical protein M3370_00650 [Actinomycetota bacterium]|nr:hypothetical protein [Actinomycetota bacterium]
MNAPRVVLVALALALLAAPTARAQDSDAPEGALGHWLPTETWVYEHWLPYDEDRLYELLDVDRGDVWRHLRDATSRSSASGPATRHGAWPGRWSSRAARTSPRSASANCAPGPFAR